MPRECKACNGNGQVGKNSGGPDGEEYVRCDACEGTGIDPRPDCEACDGTGWVYDPSDGGTMTCEACDGEGGSDEPA